MTIKPGDLLFWCSLKNIAPSENFAGAVSTVGGGPEAPFHVSLIASEVDHVVHAVETGVCLEPISDVIERYLLEHQKLKLVYASLIGVSDLQKTKAVELACTKIGRPYNDTFEEQRADLDEAYYCCQLIRKSYCNSGCTVKFPLRPVNFRDPDNKQLIPFWVEYFKRRNMEVPETGIGSHPADLYNSNIVEILSVDIVEN